MGQTGVGVGVTLGVLEAVGVNERVVLGVGTAEMDPQGPLEQAFEYA
jgi:hypothetical protein